MPTQPQPFFKNPINAVDLKQPLHLFAFAVDQVPRRPLSVIRVRTFFDVSPPFAFTITRRGRLARVWSRWKTKLSTPNAETVLRTGSRRFDRTFQSACKRPDLMVDILNDTAREAIDAYAGCYNDMLLTEEGITHIHPDLCISDAKLGPLLNAQGELVAAMQRRFAALISEP